MFLPTKLLRKDVKSQAIICRLPIPPSVKSGKSKFGIILDPNLGQINSLFLKLRSFYHSIHTEENGQRQSKLPVLVQVMMLPEGYDSNELQLEDFVHVTNFSVEDVGIDDEQAYWYFYIDRMNVRSVYSQEDGEGIFSLFQSEEVFEPLSVMQDEYDDKRKKAEAKESQVDTVRQIK